MVLFDIEKGCLLARWDYAPIHNPHTGRMKPAVSRKGWLPFLISQTATMGAMGSLNNMPQQRGYGRPSDRYDKQKGWGFSGSANATFEITNPVWSSKR